MSEGCSHGKQKSVAMRNEKGEKLRIQLTQLLWVSRQTALIRPILNNALGVESLYKNNTGIENIALGSFSMHNNNGSYNIAIGYEAMNFNTGGSYNVALGYGSGNVGPDLNNTVGIGTTNCLPGASNQVMIGNASTSFIGGAVEFTNQSDARIKNAIAEDVKGLDFILRLRENNAVDMSTYEGNEIEYWSGYKGEMEITKVEGDWVEGKFIITGRKTDADKTVEVTDGFFRISIAVKK